MPSHPARRQPAPAGSLRAAHPYCHEHRRRRRGLPAGILSDRLGKRRLLTLGTVVLIAADAVLAVAGSRSQVFAAWPCRVCTLA